MKKYLSTSLYALILCLSFYFESNAATHKKGLIAGEVWTTSGSPYIIDSAIKVACLIIKPGVVIKFSGNYEFRVSGILCAVGTPTDSIKFTRDSSTWKGIWFQNSLSGTKMAWCLIENANNSGIRIEQSYPRISDCTIRNNKSSNYGGGFYISDTSGVLEIAHCVIEKNESSNSNGGGVWVKGGGISGSVKFNNCTFRNNQCVLINGYVGGGGAFVSGNVQFIHCTFESNLSYVDHFQNSGTCIASGGGMFISGGVVSLLNTIINNNNVVANGGGGFTSYGYGGGITITGGSVKLVNSIITNDTTWGSHDSQGGGICFNGGQLFIENSSIADNNLHGIYNNSDTVVIINSILFNNNGNNAQVIGKFKINYSDIQGGYVGNGNINFDPIFYSQGSSGVYQIVSPSPCMNKGDSSSMYNDVCFPPSLAGSRNDIGAHGGAGACIWNDVSHDTLVGDTPCIVMPVKWLYFKAQLQKKDALLSWATAQEQNVKEFIVERSMNERDYRIIGSVHAAGNTFNEITYRYIDNDAFLNQKVTYYRLRQVDLDGRFSYSSIIKLIANEEFSVRATPNPFNNSIALQLSKTLKRDESVNAQLLSIEGKQLFERKLSNSTNVIELRDLPSLPSGQYILKVTVAGTVFTLKMVHQ